MNARSFYLVAGAAVALTAVGFNLRGTDAAAAAGVQVQLCDGQTTMQLPALPTDATQGRAVAMQLMNEWQQKNPGRAAEWQQEGKAQEPDAAALLQQRFQLKPPFDNRTLLQQGQSTGETYGGFTERDIAIWDRATMQLVLEGAQVFHDAGRLGSTISVSCDMCHPDAANTHPETYPKYQTQIGKAVLLRDMINWCLQHPVRAPAMSGDDPRMQALEAYILAQRTGKTLQFGKH